MRASVVAISLLGNAVLGAVLASAPAPRRLDALPIAKAWTQRIDGPAPVAAAASALAVVAGWADHLDAYLIENGVKAWSLPIPATRVACDEAMCAVADDNTIRGVDLARRAVVWQHAMPSAMSSGLTLRSGWVLTGSQSGAVRALQAADGREVWTYNALGALSGAPSINGNRVAIATKDGEVSLLDLPTGRAIWTKTFDSAAGAPRLGGGRVLVGTSNARLVVLDEADGRLRFETRTGGNVTGAPAVDEEYFYTVSQDGVLRAFDRGNGAQRWYSDLATRASAGPQVDGDLVFVPLRGGAVDVRLNTGKVAVQLPAPVGDTTRVPIAPIVGGSGATICVLIVSYDLTDSGKWALARYARAAPIAAAAMPPKVPGLALKLTAPR